MKKIKHTKEELLKKFRELEVKESNTNCYSCNSCKSCDLCNSCDYCDFCLRLTNGILCKDLRFEFKSENAYNENKYWVLNKEVSKEEFEEVKKIMEIK